MYLPKGALTTHSHFSQLPPLAQPCQIETPIGSATMPGYDVVLPAEVDRVMLAIDGWYVNRYSEQMLNEVFVDYSKSFEVPAFLLAKQKAAMPVEGVAKKQGGQSNRSPTNILEVPPGKVLAELYSIYGQVSVLEMGGLLVACSTFVVSHRIRHPSCHQSSPVADVRSPPVGGAWQDRRQTAAQPPESGVATHVLGHAG